MSIRNKIAAAAISAAIAFPAIPAMANGASIVLNAGAPIYSTPAYQQPRHVSSDYSKRDRRDIRKAKRELRKAERRAERRADRRYDRRYDRGYRAAPTVIVPAPRYVQPVPSIGLNIVID